MDDFRISRSYLEGLSVDELSRLADRYGIDIPPGLEQVFIIEELLDAAAGPGKGEAVPLREAEFLEPVPLPEQYNITFIEALIRDPLWVFVFWEINSHDRERCEGDPGFSGYFLRTSFHEEPGKSPPREERGPAREGAFTVPVGNGDRAWYLSLPPEGGRYTVTLCARQGTLDTALAVSRCFRMPEPLSRIDGRGPALSRAAPPLLRLSGLNELHVIRQMDRLSRPRAVPSPGTGQ